MLIKLLSLGVTSSSPIIATKGSSNAVTSCSFSTSAITWGDILLAVLYIKGGEKLEVLVLMPFAFDSSFEILLSY